MSNWKYTDATNMTAVLIDANGAPEFCHASELPIGTLIDLDSPPTVVTMRQARRALLAANLLTSVSSYIAAMPGTAGDQARIDWEFGNDVERGNVVLTGLLPALGLTSDQVDALFLAASTI